MTTSALALDQYRDAIALDEPFRPDIPAAGREDRARLVRAALELLSRENAEGEHLGFGEAERLDDANARRLLRAALTVRPPAPLPRETASVLDALLSGERSARASTDANALPTLREKLPRTAYRAAEHTALWQGDLTTLQADAVVNAANNAMLGCFVPQHPCIDNALHSAAGPAMRNDCHTIMELQGRLEPTGTAKITRGYHLPARYVLHTVGPIVRGKLRSEDEGLLASCYTACLDLAAQVGEIRTVAFCGVSTGLYGFPQEPAARIALGAVADWLDRHPGRLERVVFNTFADSDHATYLRALTGRNPL
ncbi:protein-ADP-ribose hydrolase [Actinospica durhamensis]|uniref:Protein-ADP-ribose hydrolase n=1 Tax=Actinospica durhamensis TaxID=1508375 RepID=A0A941EU98_9ACTN|nr:protein-ADP-ribose hydrolase [Actinospica durhamensis]MBR7838232.1 protein-ADP-ribose hydrolase [Actinospica durhamensis]